MGLWQAFVALLPRGKAWRMSQDKHSRRFLRALMLPLESVRDFAGKIWFNLFPAGSLYSLPSWEKQFNLPATNLTGDERRSRLDGAWKAQGDQDPTYLQDSLQAQGFPVFVHPWWNDTPHGVPEAKDPRDYLLPEFGGTDTDGFLLGNQVYQSSLVGPFAQCGEALMQCGEDFAQCGNFGDFSTEVIGQQYVGPTCINPDGEEYFTHPFYLYIGGETFPDTVDIPADRRSEFERLIIRLVPGQHFKVLRVRYT